MGRRINTAIAVIVGSVVLAACGGGSDPGPGGRGEGESSLVPPREVALTVTDDAFEGVPATILADPVRFTVTNDSDDTHQAYFARLNDGVTQQQFEKRFRTNPDSVFDLLALGGLISDIESGGSGNLMARFTEGNYLVVDPEVKGPPPMAFFEVGPPSGDDIETPEVDWHIETGEFYFDIPHALGGPTTVHIANVGEQGHEVVITPKGGGHGEHGGAFAVAPPPGGELWAEFDLEPGDYRVVCHFPDPKTGKPHNKLGMTDDLSIMH